MSFDKEDSCCCMIAQSSSTSLTSSPAKVSNETSKKQSLVTAIYDRYSELSSDNLSEWSFKSCSSASSSQSSSVDSSPVVSPSSATSKSLTTNLNTSNSCLLPSSSSNVVSFYIPSTCSPRKTQTGLVLSSISLVMADQCISHAGDLNELETSCKNVLELDLSKNEIDDWNEVKHILNSLKRLRLLNLSLNPLAKAMNKPEHFDSNENDSLKNLIDYFQYDWRASLLNFNLHTLILNSCFIDLRIIERLLGNFHQLSELHLSSNDYSEITFSSEFEMSSLKILYFNNNKLSDWSQVCQLGKCFPNLKQLVLSHNHLSNLGSCDNTCLNSKCFQNLEILIINRLQIDNWHVIDQLREFPSLKHVRIQNIPLLNNYTDEEKYYMLVAHLHDSIDSLNGSKITNDDKENCERKYLRHFMDMANKPERYFELENKHGKLNKLAEVNLDTNKRVYVKIKHGDKHTFEKVDVRQTVGDFKKQLEKFVGYSSARFRLFYIDIEAMSILGPEELKHPNRCLYSFNIRDGDEFEIDIKPQPLGQGATNPSSSSPQLSTQNYLPLNNLSHLHFHHYNSHVNNNSLHQIPIFNNLNNLSDVPNNGRNRKISETNRNSSSANCLNKKCKPGLSINNQKSPSPIVDPKMTCNNPSGKLTTLSSRLNRSQMKNNSSAPILKSENKK